MIRLRSVNWVHNYDDLDNYIPKVGEEYQVLCHEGHFEENATLINGHFIWCEPQCDYYDWQKAEDIICSYVVRGELKRVKEYPFDDELAKFSDNFVFGLIPKSDHVLCTVDVIGITPFVSFVEKYKGDETISSNDKDIFMDQLGAFSQFRKCLLSDCLKYIETGDEIYTIRLILEEISVKRDMHQFRIASIPRYKIRYWEGNSHTDPAVSKVVNCQLTEQENKMLFEINQKAKELK